MTRISEDLVWSQIVARAWCDQDFMHRLLSNPRVVLAEHDLEVPPGTEVEVVLGTEVGVDDTGGVRRFVLPAGPPDELTEEDLGGEVVAYSGCGARLPPAAAAAAVGASDPCIDCRAGGIPTPSDPAVEDRPPIRPGKGQVPC